MKYLKVYWHQSKSPFYSLLFALPLLLTYEILIFTMNHSDIIGMRNGADVLFRQFFSLFNVYGFYVVGFLVIITMLISYYFHSKEKKTGKFQGKYFLLMTLESILYGLFMFSLIDRLGGFTISAGFSPEIRRMVVLCLGAGVYEEFIFRVIFVTAFIFLFRDIMKLHLVVSEVAGIFFSSLIFASFHFTGTFGEVFDLRSFLVRFSAGIFLSVLFVLRGYGITAYTHTIYDILVIIV